MPVIIDIFRSLMLSPYNIEDESIDNINDFHPIVDMEILSFTLQEYVKNDHKIILWVDKSIFVGGNLNTDIYWKLKSLSSSIGMYNNLLISNKTDLVSKYKNDKPIIISECDRVKEFKFFSTHDFLGSSLAAKISNIVFKMKLYHVIIVVTTPSSMKLGMNDRKLRTPGNLQASSFCIGEQYNSKDARLSVRGECSLFGLTCACLRILSKGKESSKRKVIPFEYIEDEPIFII